MGKLLKTLRRQASKVHRHAPNPVGNDGLTDSERRESLIRFRATVGSRPAMTDEMRARVDTISEKLAGSQPPRRLVR